LSDKLPDWYCPITVLKTQLYNSESNVEDPPIVLPREVAEIIQEFLEGYTEEFQYFFSRKRVEKDI